MSTYRFPEPWSTAEIPGPKKAFVVSRPEALAAAVKRAKRRLLALGSKTFDRVEGVQVSSLASKLASTGLFTVVASKSVAPRLEDVGLKIAAGVSVYELGDRLRDPGWIGFDGNGNYDLAVFLGFPYITLWLVLSGLKHFARKLTTISLEPYYQPHASWSLPNLKASDWISFIEKLASRLGGG